MIKFNRHGKVAKFDSSNPFYAALPSTRQTMFRRAFGLLGSKAHYEADLIQSRRFVTEILQTYATFTGADLSQVLQAVTTGASVRFATNLNKRLQAAVAVRFEKGERGSVKVEELQLPKGHRWKGHISQLTDEDVLKVVMELWPSCAGVLTDQEKAQEGVEGAVNKLFAAQKAASKNFTTPRKGNVMAGVEVVNKRQAARKQSVTA